MDKKKKELILIAVLIPVFIYLVYNSVTAVSERQTEQAPEPEPEPVDMVLPEDTPPALPYVGAAPRVLDDTVLELQKTVAEGPWGRDPFRPPPVREIDRPGRNWESFKLSGIIAGRMAIIDGEPVAVGDEYQGYRLTRAEHYRITLEKDGQSYTLTIAEELQ